mgnify:CR=1 FL=1
MLEGFFNFYSFLWIKDKEFLQEIKSLWVRIWEKDIEWLWLLLGHIAKEFLASFSWDIVNIFLSGSAQYVEDQIELIWRCLALVSLV